MHPIAVAKVAEALGGKRTLGGPVLVEAEVPDDVTWEDLMTDPSAG